MPVDEKSTVCFCGDGAKGMKGELVNDKGVPAYRISVGQDTLVSGRSDHYQEHPTLPAEEVYASKVPNSHSRRNSRLYSRDRQKNELLQSYQNATQRGGRHKGLGKQRPNASHPTGTEFVLVTGRSGCGKSSLVFEAFEEQEETFVISAKFDQLDRPENYAPMVDAITKLVATIQQKPHNMQTRFQGAIREATDKQPLLKRMIPALKELLTLGSVTSTKETEPDSNLRSSRNQANEPTDLCATAAGALGQNTRGRLCFAFLTLVKSLCATGYPLVLFCDDLQWSEPASLDLLATIACDDELSGIMLIGSCRDNEVQSPSHPLSVMLREMESNQVCIRQISLDSLDLDAIRSIVANDYGIINTEDRDRLSNFVYRQTTGNALFVVLLLRLLEAEGYLNQHNMQDLMKWEQLAEIHCTDAVQLLNWQMGRSDKPLQEVLKVAACLGAEFHEALIDNVLGDDANEATINVREQLNVAQSKGLVYVVQEGVWRFSHDAVQLGAVRLTPEDDRDKFQLSLGTKLWHKLPPDQLKRHAFVVISQLRMGAHLITDQDDRNQMAAFLLSAARSAVASSAFTTASSYIETAIKLLGKRHWRDEYQLSLGLYNAAIEVNYCCGEYGRMDELTDELIRNARRKDDTHLARSNGVVASGSRGNFREAIDKGLALLGDLGLAIPSQPGVLRMLWEHRKTMKALDKFSDEDILNLPRMKDPGKLVAMRAMVTLFSFSINAEPLLGIVISSKMVRTFLTHGLADVAAPALSMFACLLVSDGFGRVKEGVRYARLGLAILEKFQSRDWLPRTYFLVYALTFPHVEPWTDSIKPLLAAHRVALSTGDFEFAHHNASLYLALSFATCTPLDELWSDIKVFLVLAKTKKQAKVDHFIRPLAQFAANLMGQSQDPLVLSGSIMDEEIETKEARESTKQTNLKLLQFLKLKLLSYFHRYEEGEAVALWLANQPMEDLAVFAKAAIFLHSGLVVAGVALKQKSVSRWRMNHVKLCLKRIKAMAKHACTDSCSMVLALEAAHACMRGKHHHAAAKFEQCLQRATEQGFLDVLGVVGEHFAYARLRRGRREEALKHFESACCAYARWGATAKVADVKRRMDEAKALLPVASAN